jgi:hypothetical protein
MVKHKCAACGYLATRNLKTRILEEMEYDFRQSEEITTVGEMLQIYDYPVCFKRKADLQTEIDGSDASISKIASSILNTIQKERDCKSFTKWYQGLTPKEHQEMLDEQWKLEQEEKRRKSDRKWHLVELGITLAVGAIIALVAAYIKA